jgi:protein MpaA
MSASNHCVRRLAGVFVTILALYLVGCASHPAPAAKLLLPPTPPPPPPTAVVPPRHVEPEGPLTVELGRSVEGRPIEAIVFPGKSGCILILGNIHGDEPLAGDLVEHMAEYLKAHPGARADRTIVLIPHANPDGLAAGTRWNAHGVDLNRNFPTRNFTAGARHGPEPLSEPESGALVAAIARYKPSCVISLHAPLSCIDPDGGRASSALAHEMALYSPFPVKVLPAWPGSLGSYAGNELHLKMITYELDQERMPAWSSGEYIDRHLKPLLVAVQQCTSSPSPSQRTVDHPARKSSTGSSLGN